MNQFFQMPVYFLFVIIFSLITFFNWLGYRYKKRRLALHPGQTQEGMGSIEGSMMGIMALLMGFTFSMAMSKFEARRNLIVEEANHIGTAILRCDIYPDSIRAAFHGDFKEYVQARIDYYRAGNDEDKIQEEIKKAEEISGSIWKRAVTVPVDDLTLRLRSQLMLTTLNDMIDIVATRDASRVNRVPTLVMCTLLFLVLSASFILGSDFKGQQRNYMLLIGYALSMTLALNLITELNHPREGLINLGEAEQKIEDLKKLL